MDVANCQALNIKRKAIVYDSNHDHHRVSADAAVKCQKAFEVSANNF